MLDADFSDERFFDLAGGLEDVINEHLYGLDQSDEGELGEMEEQDEHPGASCSDAGPSVGAGVYMEGGSSSSTDPGTATGHIGIVPEHVEAVSEAAEAASDAAAHPEGTELSLGGSLALRPHGSVVCSLHPFEGLSLGTVGRPVLRTKIFANCHLHPHCEIHVVAYSMKEHSVIISEATLLKALAAPQGPRIAAGSSSNVLHGR